MGGVKDPTPPRPDAQLSHGHTYSVYLVHKNEAARVEPGPGSTPGVNGAVSGDECQMGPPIGGRNGANVARRSTDSASRPNRWRWG